MTTSRYLTEPEKARALESWFGVLHDLPWQPGNAAGDRGDPDADMIPWCMRLNRLAGVVTLQSCSGHRRGDYLEPGHLWLWFSRTVDGRFAKQAHALAASPTIEDVSRLYKPDGREIVALTFRGNERDSLAVSMDRICTFIEQIATRAP